VTAEQIASLAASLRDNEAFNMALDNARNSALERLAVTEPTNTVAILANQAVVKVIDELRGDLEQFIRSGTPKKPAGIA
jgi:hypothetical protein